MTSAAARGRAQLPVRVRLAVSVGAVLGAAVGAGGCGSSLHGPAGQGGGARARGALRGIPPALVREMRPIGKGPRFQPPLRGRPSGRCRPALGARYGAHVEVFAADRVVILPAGVGTAAPRQVQDARVTRARCYGSVVTIQPTGVVLVRRGPPPTIGQLFRAWGQPLGPHRIASFSGGPVRAYIAGHRTAQQPSAIHITRHAEIVLEIGPYVPPHPSFTFPPGI